MAKAYYSTVFEQKAADVWKIVRDFNSYPVWVGGAGESEIEGGRSGDSVGAVRNVLYRERRIRQRLLALSDVERSQSYEFCSAPSLPIPPRAGNLAGARCSRPIRVYFLRKSGCLARFGPRLNCCIHGPHLA